MELYPALRNHLQSHQAVAKTMLFENRRAAYSTYVSSGSAEKFGLQPGLMTFQVVS